jgi:hypothetical protein
MTRLIHETDVSSSCGPEDDDFTAFIVVTSLIGGRDTVEEFLANGLWPLGRCFGGNEGISAFQGDCVGASEWHCY